MWLPLSAPAVNVKEFAHGPIQLWLRRAAFAGWKATAGVDRRRNDWAPRSLEGREFEEVIMIASCDRSGLGQTEFRPPTIKSGAKWESANPPRERNGALLRAHGVVCSDRAWPRC